MRASKNYYKDLIEDLKDPDEATAYLNAALTAGDKTAFLLALKNVLKARGGMAKISRQTNMNRVSLYKMLSKNGNPGFENIFHLLRSLGIQFRVESQPDLK